MTATLPQFPHLCAQSLASQAEVELRATLLLCVLEPASLPPCAGFPPTESGVKRRPTPHMVVGVATVQNSLLAATQRVAM